MTLCVTTQKGIIIGLISDSVHAKRAEAHFWVEAPEIIPQFFISIVNK